MPFTPAPLIEVDWWALGAVIGLSAGAMLLLLLEFLPSRPNSSRGAIVALLTLGASAYSVRASGEQRIFSKVHQSSSGNTQATSGKGKGVFWELCQSHMLG